MISAIMDGIRSVVMAAFTGLTSVVYGIVSEIRETVGYLFDKISPLLSMVLDKLRVNVIIVAGLITWLIMDFGDKLISQLNKADALPPEVIITVLTTLIGTGIGGLIVTMGRMFDSPSVPADTHERMVKNARKVSDNG